MDRISGLPDELLVKILSFRPTKAAVSTSILSKKWKFIWMLLPKLKCIIRRRSESKRLLCFLDRNLPSHRAPVIKSFCLDFRASQVLKPEDITSCVLAAVSRNLRELEISPGYSRNEMNILPSSLYTCKSLVTLKLKGSFLVDVPRIVCLPCLKTLKLKKVGYFNKDSFQQLLSNLPVLEDLVVNGQGFFDDNMGKFIVIVPSLQSLKVATLHSIDEFVICTPSLKYLRLEYYNYKSHSCLIENMPKLEEAYAKVGFFYSERLIKSITSVERLTLCSGIFSPEFVSGDSFVFNQLEHLNICTCQVHVISRLLKDSPNLRVLNLEHHNHSDKHVWNQPSNVRESVLSNLQTFRWSRFIGTQYEKDLLVYILENANHLKRATILPIQRDSSLGMIKELALSSQASTSCQLVFDIDNP